MFTSSNLHSQLAQYPLAAQGNYEVKAVREALARFDNALRRGWLSRVLQALGFSRRKLMALNTLASGSRIRSRHYAGLQSVPVSLIQGSEGRVGDFDAAFNPLSSKTRDRWLSIARARLLGTEMPPVELIQIKERYFVRDGHHRISVACSLGEFAVDAEVTLWEVNGSLPWEKSPVGVQVQTQAA